MAMIEVLIAIGMAGVGLSLVLLLYGISRMMLEKWANENGYRIVGRRFRLINTGPFSPLLRSEEGDLSTTLLSATIMEKEEAVG
jgi:hypothetical protein